MKLKKAGVLIPFILWVIINTYAQNVPITEPKEGIFIKEWLICGTFPNPLKEGIVEYRHDETTLGFYIDYLANVGGESNIRPEEGQTVDPGDGIVRTWKKYISPEDYINFHKVFSDTQGGKVAYAFCYVNSAAEMEKILAVGSNDGIRIWLNGELVWDNHCARGAMKDEDCFYVQLKEGLNPLLIKVDQGYGNWGFYCRFINREEVVQKLKEIPDIRADIKYEIENNTLRAWMARHSRYRVLIPPVQYTIQLINPNDEILQKNSANLGSSVTFSLAGLEEGPYKLKGKFELPDGTTIEKQTFYYHGKPTVLVTFDKLPEKYRPVRVELLADIQQQKVKDSEVLKSQDYLPTLDTIPEGVLEIETGKFAILRTDLSPIWIRALLPAPGLGHIWYMLNDSGYRFNTNDKIEIDGFFEIEKNLRNKISQSIEKGNFPNAEWLFNSFNERLILSFHKPSKGEISTEERLRRIHRFSTLKSKIKETDTAIVWFSPSIEKVGSDEQPPDMKLEFAPLDLARNEYEAMQIVITPKTQLSPLKVTISDGKTKEGYTLSASQFKIYHVNYVPIKELSDYYGDLTEYPDPLVPVKDYIQGEAKKNTVLWIKLYATKSQVPGIYEGSIQIQSSELNIEIPYKIRVFNYTLPSETNTETAYGVSPDYSWHGPLNDDQKREVFDLYMRTCMEYRISPYHPHVYGPIQWRFEGDPPQAVVDFSSFDREMEKYLNQYRFNTFNVGGLPSELNGAPIHSPEYNRLFTSIYSQVQEHLREKGWLHKAYWYWVDEPPLAEYPNVRKGMELLKSACPDIRRLLTCNQELAPVPYFFGSVNLWVPILNFYDETRAKWRQTLGEHVWWYVCTAPRAPYANNFIDHPGINHRIRYWQMDKFELDGDLFWSITYWAQNPWEEAMSIGDGDQRWGNGDGRMLYPPRRVKPTEPVIEPPIPSIRLECLRDGLEDREYLIVLQRATARRLPFGAMSRSLRTEALNALTPSLKVYEQNPLFFYLYRSRIMITVSIITQGGS